MARPIRRIDTSARFEKEFSRLPRHIQQLAHKKDALFRTDAFHPLLKTHKLGGALKDDWSYSVNQQYRVHFYFVDDHTVSYINIGTHEIYK
ncbi:MAG: type II toxin-antitoxin system mRNA interferase toxin, RelE/StbE family [Patescibacteria group bacterium]